MASNVNQDAVGPGTHNADAVELRAQLDEDAVTRLPCQTRKHTFETSDCCVHAILADRWPSEIVMKPSPYSTSGCHVPWIESYLIRYAIDSGAAMSFKCTISNVSGMSQAILSTSRPAQRTHMGEPACAHACATPLLTPILVKQCSQGAPLGTRARTRRISAQSCQIRGPAYNGRTNPAQAIESNLCWHECLRAGAGASGNLSCLRLGAC